MAPLTRKRGPMDTQQISLNGLKFPVTIRPGSSDEVLVRRILVERSEYKTLVNCKPKVIFDVGANIGITSLLLNNAYPDANIFAFEPEKRNYELLRQNVSGYDNICELNFGLGNKNYPGLLCYSDNPTNYGGFSMHVAGTNPEKNGLIIDVISIIEFIRIQRIEKIDLMKIDTEGCEHEILEALYKEDLLPTVIMGEAHGVKDFEMFQMLENTHHLAFNKEVYQRCYEFLAVSKQFKA